MVQFVQLSVKVEQSSAVMVSVFPPLFTVMGLNTAQMAVMRLDVVSYSLNYTVCMGSHAFNILTSLLQFVQLLVKVEHFGAPIVSVSAPLIAVTELVTALMAVMRLDAVSLYIPTTVAWYSSSVISGMWQSIYLILYQTFQETKGIS